MFGLTSNGAPPATSVARRKHYFCGCLFRRKDGQSVSYVIWGQTQNQHKQTESPCCPASLHCVLQPEAPSRAVTRSSPRSFMGHQKTHRTENQYNDLDCALDILDFVFRPLCYQCLPSTGYGLRLSQSATPRGLYFSQCKELSSTVSSGTGDNATSFLIYFFTFSVDVDFVSLCNLGTWLYSRGGALVTSQYFLYY